MGRWEAVAEFAEYLAREVRGTPTQMIARVRKSKKKKKTTTGGRKRERMDRTQERGMRSARF